MSYLAIITKVKSNFCIQSRDLDPLQYYSENITSLVEVTHPNLLLDTGVLVGGIIHFYTVYLNKKIKGFCRLLSFE